MACDARVTEMFHRIFIQYGMYGFIIPFLDRMTAPSFQSGGVWAGKSVLQVVCGGNYHIDDMVSRMSAFLQQQYPYEFESQRPDDESTTSASDDLLYVAMLAPVLCGPVTGMAIAVNWFCMKIFKHNI